MSEKKSTGPGQRPAPGSQQQRSRETASVPSPSNPSRDSKSGTYTQDSIDRSRRNDQTVSFSPATKPPPRPKG